MSGEEDNKKYDTPIKAKDLIEAIKNGHYRAKVVDEGGLRPYLSSASIDVDEDNYCSVTAGYYSYNEDSATCGVNPGLSEADVLGVLFWRAVLSPDEIEIRGREIEYADGLTKYDVLEAAEEYIHFPSYDVDNYEFDESAVTSEELCEALANSISGDYVFAFDDDGELRAYDSEEDVPEDYDIIEEDQALEYLSSDPDLIPYYPENW